MIRTHSANLGGSSAGLVGYGGHYGAWKRTHWSGDENYEVNQRHGWIGSSLEYIIDGQEGGALLKKTKYVMPSR